MGFRKIENIKEREGKEEMPFNKRSRTSFLTQRKMNSKVHLITS